ncbi:MAG: hypothetical protein WAM14_11670 [Candidatus Nitrosopolaris sp.]
MSTMYGSSTFNQTIDSFTEFTIKRERTIIRRNRQEIRQAYRNVCAMVFNTIGIERIYLSKKFSLANQEIIFISVS